jgi:hypothetical protein
VQRRLAERISKVGTTYRGSPIVAERRDAGPGPHAGDRLPDPVLTDGRRLSDALGDGLRHVLLVHGADAGALAAEIERRGLGDLVVVKTFGSDLPPLDPRVARALDFRTAAVFLIRPDLHLALCARGLNPHELAAAVGAALDAVFPRPGPFPSRA